MGVFFLLVIPKRSFSAVVIIACLIKPILADKYKRRQAGAAIQKNIILASLQIELLPRKISCHVPSGIPAHHTTGHNISLNHP